jgi:hypothetical protein
MLNRSPVVLIGVDRHAFGRDNGPTNAAAYPSSEGWNVSTSVARLRVVAKQL